MFLWIVIVGFISAFITSCGIGANDVANSFASSVGAKVLKLKHALVIAAIFEMAGAVLMGSRVTDTIRKKIVDQDIFDADVYVLMFGMLCASISTAIWLGIATWFKAPVSTTHSTIGAVLGFAMVYAAELDILDTAIDWDKVWLIIASWVISPMIAGVLTSIILCFNKWFALRTNYPVERAFKIMPFMVFLTIAVIVFFIIYKGTPELDLDDTPLGNAIGISIGVGVAGGIIALIIIRFYLYDKIMKTTRLPNDIYNVTIENRLEQEPQIKHTIPEHNTDEMEEIPLKNMDNDDNTMNEHDEHHNKYKNDKFKDMEMFDPKAEKLYSYLQIFTACVSAFAHGSNDIANSIAPIVAIYTIYKDGSFASKSDVPIWILFIGGAGIVVGLAIWGWRIIGRLGRELSGMTPCRGFSIELGAALAVVTASRLEIPVSTTHCQVGSIVGSGLTDGFKDGCSTGVKNIKDRGLPNVDLTVFAKIVFGWIITLPVTMAISALLFSFAQYSPISTARFDFTPI